MKETNTANDPKKPSFTDIAELRRRARENIDQGAVTTAYHGDVNKVIDLLNQALATELVCMLRYKRHYFMARGIAADSIATEFQEHATQEQQHADQLAARIVQLGGEPDFSPQGLATRSHAEYVPGTDVYDMIQEDLVAERIAIESYAEMVRYIGGDDPTTRRLLEQVLAVEEEHAEDMKTLLESMGKARQPLK